MNTAVKMQSNSKEQRLVAPFVVGETSTTAPYLALGMTAAYLRSRQEAGDLAGYWIEPLHPYGYLGRPLESIHEVIADADDPICLFSSYVWNHHLNLEIASQIKARKPAALIIFGGPHVPKYEQQTDAFFAAHPFVDIAVLGEGELTLAEALSVLQGDVGADLSVLAHVNGLAFRLADEVVRTPSRDKLRDVSILPSPYLSGEFEPWFEQFDVTVLETNRGCPYGCTYCDWGSATLSRVSRFAPERVLAEIEYIASRQSKAIFIADANFGMLEQDIEIARGLVATRRKYGYPQRIMTNFAKNGGRRLMEVIKILHEGGLLPIGIIALQTTDTDVLKAIARDNIKTESFETMMRYFNDERIPMASDLMIGLPEQTVDSFAADLQYCFDWKISASANYTSLMPNAPMAESDYQQHYQIQTGENNLIVASSSFSTDDLEYMKKLYTSYLFHVRFAVAKYLLIYLQLEHQLEAITVLRCWLDKSLAADPTLPLSGRVVAEIFSRSVHTDWAMLVWKDNADFLFDDIEVYYEEMLDFVQREFDVEIAPSQVRTLVLAQQAVMPRAGRRYPYQVHLDHGMGAYIEQAKSTATLRAPAEPIRPLQDFQPELLEVTHCADVIDSNQFVEIGTHADAWELPSVMRFY